MNFKIPAFLMPSLFVTLLLASCYPVDDDKVEDYDLAVTLFDKEYYSVNPAVNKFHDFQTFYMTDSITHVVDEGAVDDIDPNRKLDPIVIKQVAKNMKSAGFTEVSTPDSAELYMTIAYTKTTFENLHFYFSGGGYYYYSWATYGSYTTSYDTGTILMEMVEKAKLTPNNDTIPVIWAGLVNGVINESKTNNQERLTKSIDQCFIQSPYLNKISK